MIKDLILTFYLMCRSWWKYNKYERLTGDINPKKFSKKENEKIH